MDMTHHEDKDANYHLGILVLSLVNLVALIDTSSSLGTKVHNGERWWPFVDFVKLLVEFDDDKLFTTKLFHRRPRSPCGLWIATVLLHKFALKYDQCQCNLRQSGYHINRYLAAVSWLMPRIEGGNLFSLVRQCYIFPTFFTYSVCQKHTFRLQFLHARKFGNQYHGCLCMRTWSWIKCCLIVPCVRFT